MSNQWNQGDPPPPKKTALYLCYVLLKYSSHVWICCIDLPITAERCLTCIPPQKKMALDLVSGWDYPALRPCRLDFRETPWLSAWWQEELCGAAIKNPHHECAASLCGPTSLGSLWSVRREGLAARQADSISQFFFFKAIFKYFSHVRPPFVSPSTL